MDKTRQQTGSIQANDPLTRIRDVRRDLLTLLSTFFVYWLGRSSYVAGTYLSSKVVVLEKREAVIHLAARGGQNFGYAISTWSQYWGDSAAGGETGQDRWVVGS